MEDLSPSNLKTIRGGLVIDVADLAKDATILQRAFIAAVRGDEEQDLRRPCIERLTRSEALDFMIDTVKAVAEQTGRLAQTPVPPTQGPAA